jgi:hypothetical protein
MSVNFKQFSLKSLFLLLTLACIGTRFVSRVVEMQQNSAAQHRQSEQFFALAGRFPPEDRADCKYCLDRARYHLMLATEYDWAVFYPWLAIQDPGPPPPPAAVRRMMRQV